MSAHGDSTLRVYSSSMSVATQMRPYSIFRCSMSFRNECTQAFTQLYIIVLKDGFV